MAPPHQPVRVTAARMALLTSKPLNVNGAYAQNSAYLVLLTGPASGAPPAAAVADAE